MRRVTSRVWLLVAIAGLPPLIQAQTPEPIQVRPGAGLTMRPAPEFTLVSPTGFVVQGDTMLLRGRFAPYELVVEIGTPATSLEITGRSLQPATDGTSWVAVRIPQNYVSAGALLRARHGSNGAYGTINASQRVVARPTVTSFRVLGTPAIDLTDHGSGAATTVEVSLTGYVPGLEQPALRFPDCEPETNRTFRRPTREIPGSPYRILFDKHFVREYSGRNCTAELHPYSFLVGTPPPSRYSVTVGRVQLPSVASYTIEDTEDLLDHTTPSGRKLQATASKGLAPCQLGSVGSAGTFSTGVVRSGGDLTFQLRNGLLIENCEFKTTPALEVRDGWRMERVDWSFSETSLCSGEEFALQQPGGALVSVFRNDDFLYPVAFQATCRTNSNDLPRNSHVYLARLARVVVLGPAGQRWQDAFK
jgi:hypothetical protein